MLPVFFSGTATTSRSFDICWMVKSGASAPGPTKAPGCTRRSVTTPSKGAVIRKYDCISRSYRVGGCRPAGVLTGSNEGALRFDLLLHLH